MKVKEAERTANVAWSPAPLPRLMLAAGTAAQQLDATFSSTARLEILGLALDDTALQMPVLASVDTAARFHCVSWGSGGAGGTRPAGVIVGGSDGGQISLYDAQNLLDGRPALIETTSRHTGAVRALDFNPFQANLLASGAADSELYIWDLNSPGTPMTPGAKAQPPEDVAAVSWNRQVQHILASTFASRCVVWDLRKNEPIIKVGHGQAGMKCKVLAWHPEVATQLVLASEDDQTPTIQLWDLRFATAPLRTLQRHQKGILSLSWCERDSHLLLSAGKDDKILCWDPHSDLPGGEVVAELSASPQWNFSVDWCPRNPALIAGCSFDGHVSVYNVMGPAEEPPTSPTSTLADSFPDMAGVAAALPAAQRRTSVPLTRPPRWLSRPCGASFAFGGRLVSFCHSPTTDGGRPAAQVQLHQVVTEPELVQRSQAFQQVLQTDSLAGFCAERAESAAEGDRPVWRFLAARLSAEPRAELLGLLGYQSQPQRQPPEDQAMPEAAAAEPIAEDAISGRQGSSESPTAEPEELFDIPAGEDTDGLVSQAILRGDMAEAVDRCVQADRMADALIIAQAASEDLYRTTRHKYLESMKTDLSRLISALVSHDWSGVVGRCDPGSWREALVAVLTHAPPEQVAPLCESLGARLELQHTEAMWTNALLCYVCAGAVDRLVHCWERTRPDSDSPHSLQELLEQALTLYRATQLAGAGTAPLGAGGLQQKLVRFAELLAGQGSLQTALGYLAHCDHPAAAALSERLQHCLTPAVSSGAGQAAARQAAPAARFPAAGQPYQPPPAVSSARDGRPAQPQPAFQPPVAPVAPLVPAPTQPAAPPAGGAGPGYRLGGRRQYAADPSLSGPGAAGYGVMGGYGSASPAGYGVVPAGQPAGYGTAPAGQPAGYGAAPSGQPAGYGAAPAGQPVGYGAAPTGQPAGYGTAPTGQPTGYGAAPAGQPAGYGAAPAVFTPSLSEPQPVSQPAVQPFTPAPAATGPEFSAPGPAGPAVSSGPGWNDPPPLRRSAKKTSTTTTSVLNTVTQAIYNPAEMAAIQPPANTYPAGMYQAAPSGQFSPYQAAPSGQFSPYQAAPSGQFSPYQPPPPPPTAQEPPPPAAQQPPPPKGPVPPEHAPLQDTLEHLRSACAAAASTAQARRRLEDVSRRLELLYDLLRAGSLCPATLQGLHQLAEWVRRSDWTAAQQQLAALVAASNMAEIAGFMPGIKTLLQMAASMQVQM